MSIEEVKSVRIVSDGTPLGTHVYDHDGNKIKSHITAIEWSIQAGANEVGVAKISFPLCSVDIIGEVKDG